MNRRQVIQQLPVELYTQDEVLTGHISCPSSSRLLDLLNHSVVKEWNSRNEFSIFDGFICPDSESEHQEVNRLYMRKSAIHFVAVNDADVGRGAGTERDRQGYPVVCKSSIRATLRLPNHKLIGNIHCSKGQTVQDLMNSDMAFLPLTDVTITREQHIYGTKPFVAVNKEQIIWSQEERII